MVDVDPLALGLAAVELGAGRTRADQEVDPRVGLVLRATKGTRVESDVALAEVHARDERSVDAVRARIGSAFTIAESSEKRGPLVLETIRARLDFERSDIISSIPDQPADAARAMVWAGYEPFAIAVP